MAKSFLGCSKSTHVGSMVAVLSEARILTRAGTTVAKHVVMARARLACLPKDHPAVVAASTIIMNGLQDTWMSHTKHVASTFLGVQADLWDKLDSIGSEVRNDSKQRKQLLRTFYIEQVLPRLRAMEDKWFKEQVAALNSGSLIPYKDLVPLRMDWTAGHSWANWTPSMWHLHRLWILCRVTGKLPILRRSDQQFLPVLSFCPLCSSRVVTGLLNCICMCPITVDLRDGYTPGSGPQAIQFLQAVLSAKVQSDLEARKRIMLAGGAVARVVQALRMSTA